MFRLFDYSVIKGFSLWGFIYLASYRFIFPFCFPFRFYVLFLLLFLLYSLLIHLIGVMHPFPFFLFQHELPPCAGTTGHHFYWQDAGEFSAFLLRCLVRLSGILLLLSKPGGE